jgi:hypothetical protein
MEHQSVVNFLRRKKKSPINTHALTSLMMPKVWNDFEERLNAIIILVTHTSYRNIPDTC